MAINITNNTFFVNDLYIPLSQSAGMSTLGANQAPNNQNALNDVISQVEEDILLYSLGVTVYNELQIALADIDNTIYLKYKELVQGKSYTKDGKEYIWEGLSSPKSLLCYAVYYCFLDANSDFYNSIGVNKPNAENSTNSTPVYKLVSAWSTFLSKYQSGCLSEPLIYSDSGSNFIDYYGNNDNIKRSLYQFLNDNATDYSFDNSKFRLYSSINTFGI